MQIRLIWDFINKIPLRRRKRKVSLFQTFFVESFSSIFAALKVGSIKELSEDVKSPFTGDEELVEQLGL